MERIVCKGKYRGRMIEVECTREQEPGLLLGPWDVSVNGKYNAEIGARVNIMAAECHPFAGTYCPEDRDSVYYMLSGLNFFFDRPPEITVLETDEELPEEEDEEELIF